MIYNGHDLCEYVTVNDVRRSLLPPQTNVTKKIGNRSGVRFIRKELEPKLIEVDVTLLEFKPSILREKARLFAGKLYSEKEEKLILLDEPDKYNLATLEGGTPIVEDVVTGEVTLSFICFNPLDVSEEKTKVDLSHTIVNNGTYKTTGTIKVVINQAVNHLKITLQKTGEYIYLEDNFKKGDVVVVNLEEEFVKKNNDLIMTKLHFSSDFFEIPIGEFGITLSSGEGTLEFRERWL